MNRHIPLKKLETLCWIVDLGPVERAKTMLLLHDQILGALKTELPLPPMPYVATYREDCPHSPEALSRSP